MSTNSLRLVFAGTPDFAARHLAALLACPHQLAAVYTQPDRPAGRGKKLQASPVKQLALDAGIPVYQPPSLRDDEARQALAELQPDVLVVVAYGLILPQAVLDIPRLGCLNVHASLLPRWRGAAPIQRAIEAGDRETGVTIMQMDAGLDTGAMLASSRCQIDPATTAASLHDQLAELGAPLLLAVLDDLENYQRSAQVQDDQLATYAEKIRKEEALVDWDCAADQLALRIAAFNPFPVCYSLLGKERIRIWQACCQPLPGHVAPPGTILQADNNGLLVACGSGALLLQQLQLPGGRAMAVSELLNSRGELLAAGGQFSSAPSGTS